MPTLAQIRRSIKITTHANGYLVLSEQSDVAGGGPFADIAMEPHFLFLRDGNNVKITTPDGKFTYIVSLELDNHGKQDTFENGEATIEEAMTYLENILA